MDGYKAAKGGSGSSSRSYNKSTEGISKNRATIRRKRNAKRRAAAEAEEDVAGDLEGEESIGVNKIKAALRQTKRLLAKEKLSASSRQDAERKLAALEDELERRSSAQKERKNAQRYHKIRFFERQKLTRRIAKAKRTLSEESLTDQQRKEAEESLLSNRILLNYVLHFPMTQKYVALFPNSGPSPLDDQGAEDNEESKDSRRRMQLVRTQITEAMGKGEISGEPEIELQNRGQNDNSTGQSKRKILSSGVYDKQGGKKKQKVDDPPPNTESNLQDDDFFA